MSMPRIGCDAYLALRSIDVLTLHIKMLLPTHSNKLAVVQNLQLIFFPVACHT